MKSTFVVLLVWGAAVAVLLPACTSDPILPPGFIETIDPNEPCPDGIISFQREIMPILSSNCAFSGCHDAISAEDGVILDSYENVMRDVVPGNPNESELYECLVESDDDIMPPNPYDRLSSQQITLIRDWIKQGALNIECGGCDTTNVTFAGTVYPILETQCVTCHNNNRQDGNVNLEGYAMVQQSGASGALLGTIEHQAGYAAMPPSGIPIDGCFVDQIKKWVADGMPNN